MFPLLLLPLLAIGGLGAYLLTQKSGSVTGYQSITRTGANGVPVTVQVPVTSGNAPPPPPIVTTPTGTSSLSVQSLTDTQRALNTLGYGPLEVNGLPSPALTNAIANFQTAQGARVAQGDLNGNTVQWIQTALAKLATPVAAVGAHPTVVGATTSTPVAVNTPKDVQHALNLLGATPPLTEDGSIGTLSKAAVRAFQQTHGLAVDGDPGPNTKAALTLALRSIA